MAIFWTGDQHTEERRRTLRYQQRWHRCAALVEDVCHTVVAIALVLLFAWLFARPFFD